MTKDDYIEALLCIADDGVANESLSVSLGLGPNRDWGAMDEATEGLWDTFYFTDPKKPWPRTWLRPLEYATALLAGDADYPAWVGGGGGE